MKILNLILASTVLIAGISLQSCKKDIEEILDNENSIIPINFKIDIPESISSSNLQKSLMVTNDSLEGGEIYNHLRTFIHVGESAAEIVNNIMATISTQNINQAMSLSYQSDDDGRVKNLVVVENSTFDGLSWEYELTITDADNATNIDLGNALQVFWNTSPVKGIATLKPFNIDLSQNTAYPDAMYKIEYSEEVTGVYEKHMIVSINGLPLADPAIEPYSMSSLKMFAGKNGDIIDVYGNSEHPNAWFFHQDTTGFDWAFVASSNGTSDIAVAEVGLPSISVDAIDRGTLLVTNSIKNVFTDLIYIEYPNIDSASVANYLVNTNPPGYFNNAGFIQAGIAPNASYIGLVSNIASLTPYNPTDINNITISFK